ncbi:MAG: class I SAM-dependent methyltransferase [Acidimicrobiia bacterium]
MTLDELRAKVSGGAARGVHAAPDGVRRGVGRAGRWLTRAADVPGPPVWTSPPLPVPVGTTEDDVRALLDSVSVDGAPPAELAAYAADAFGRLLHTWGMVAVEHGRALEIGANLYFMTVLLAEHTSLELELTNWFGDGRPDTLVQVVEYTEPAAGKSRRLELTSSLVDIERAAMPYEDDVFDLVVFCEVLEHLTEDPLAALVEIRRVLRPGGVLVLTTPNVARLENVVRMVLGENIYDPYSGYGPTGRHNREYSRHELHLLLEHVGFAVEDSFTADAHPDVAPLLPRYAEVAPLVTFRSPDLGQHLFVRARLAAEPCPGRPAWLFRSYPEGEIATG